MDSRAGGEHQLGEIDSGRLPRSWSSGGPELERSETARREVGKAVERRDCARRYALAHEVGRGKSIAKGIGERIGEQCRQTMEGLDGERGEHVPALVERHGGRRQLDAAS